MTLSSECQPAIPHPSWVISAAAMANFQMEGQGMMTGVFRIVWRIEPVIEPRPRRNCSTCGRSQLFRSSGKIRMNAHGRRLDAWLIYRCEVCDQTWNLPLVERAAVIRVPETDLQAMSWNDPAWVREREYDLARLARHCDQIDIPSDLTVTKSFEGDMPEAWTAIDLEINAQRATGLRLDRLLASELRLARSALQTMQQTGGLKFTSVPGKMLRKPARGGITLQFVASRLTESHRAVISRNLIDREQELRPSRSVAE